MQQRPGRTARRGRQVALELVHQAGERPHGPDTVIPARDPGLPARTAWYERATLLRKIHSLLTDTTRHPEPEALRRRQGEAVRLLWTGT